MVVCNCTPSFGLFWDNLDHLKMLLFVCQQLPTAFIFSLVIFILHSLIWKKRKKVQFILIQDAHICIMGLIGLCQRGKYVENMATEEILSDTKQKIWKLTHKVLWCESILQCQLQTIHDDKQWQGHQLCFNIWILDKKEPKSHLHWSVMCNFTDLHIC